MTLQVSAYILQMTNKRHFDWCRHLGAAKSIVQLYRLKVRMQVGTQWCYLGQLISYHGMPL